MAEKRESNKTLGTIREGESVKPLSNSLKVKLELDCAEALKGLKAVTRAAKKATAALKELEEQINKSSVNNSITLNVDGRKLSEHRVRKGMPDVWIGK
ncbi:hypothetical protein [Neobacillus niacini]|uniref:hypothetical protein n=1 Tax=Neobacillus niacini TaxID=86668 RepID=UPI0021CB6BC7|nr:hypothetical protein [Neobacillus niacini]MCM3763457.1 hypothetical protein [Neobacillus niacini]